MQAEGKEVHATAALFAKLMRRYQEYTESVRVGDSRSGRNALRALLDECHLGEPGGSTSRVFVENRLGFTYMDLLNMERSGELQLDIEVGSIPPPMSSHTGQRSLNSEG